MVCKMDSRRVEKEFKKAFSAYQTIPSTFNLRTFLSEKSIFSRFSCPAINADTVLELMITSAL